MHVVDQDRTDPSTFYHLTKFKVCLNSLPNDKFLDWSKLKAFADDKINVTDILKVVLGQVENIVGEGEQHFLLFPQCFQKFFFSKVVKSRDCVE